MQPHKRPKTPNTLYPNVPDFPQARNHSATGPPTGGSFPGTESDV